MNFKEEKNCVAEDGKVEKFLILTSWPHFPIGTFSPFIPQFIYLEAVLFSFAIHYHDFFIR